MRGVIYVTHAIVVWMAWAWVGAQPGMPLRGVTDEPSGAEREVAEAEAEEETAADFVRDGGLADPGILPPLRPSERGVAETRWTIADGRVLGARRDGRFSPAFSKAVAARAKGPVFLLARRNLAVAVVPARSGPVWVMDFADLRAATPEAARRLSAISPGLNPADSIGIARFIVAPGVVAIPEYLLMAQARIQRIAGEPWLAFHVHSSGTAASDVMLGGAPQLVPGGLTPVTFHAMLSPPTATEGVVRAERRPAPRRTAPGLRCGIVVGPGRVGFGC